MLEQVGFLYDIDRNRSRNCNVNTQLRYAYMVGAADKNFSYMYFTGAVEYIDGNLMEMVVVVLV